MDCPFPPPWQETGIQSEDTGVGSYLCSSKFSKARSRLKPFLAITFVFLVFSPQTSSCSTPRVVLAFWPGWSHSPCTLMSTPISLWNGKVRKLSLPVFDNPAESAPTEPKRLRLAQGELAQIFTGSPGIRYLAALELRAGTLRGNHSHERKHEFVYLISGRMEETKAPHQERFICQAGDLVEIAPGIAHAFRVLESGTGLEFSPQEFDASDVQRCRLLECP